MRLLVPVPDPDEQAAIARILDAVDTALERKPVLRSPVSPSSKPAARPRSAPAGAAPARGQPWALYLALCVILGYCVHLLLSS